MGLYEKGYCDLRKEEWTLGNPNPKEPPVPIFDCRAAQFGNCFPSNFHVSYRLLVSFKSQCVFLSSTLTCFLAAEVQ